MLEQWWFWAIVGGAAVAIGVGLAIGLTIGVRAEAPDGSLAPGRVVLPLAAW